MTKQIYIIYNSSTDLYKIGVTSNINDRLKQLQSVTGCELKVMYTSKFYNHAELLEVKIHNALHEYNFLHEWFKVKYEIILDIITKIINNETYYLDYILFDEVINRKFIKEVNIEYLSATNMVQGANKWRQVNNMTPFNLSQWLKQKSSVEFIEDLKNKYGNPIISSRGRQSHTWVHPFLFIDIALVIHPKLKIETYEWLFEYVKKYNYNKNDSFKKMSGALYNSFSNKREFQTYIQEVSRKIKLACNISTWDDWQKASEETLKKRDKIQENIALLCDILPVDKAVEIGILKGQI